MGIHEDIEVTGSFCCGHGRKCERLKQTNPIELLFYEVVISI